MLVTIDDIRQAGHCVSGTRDWFVRYGLDFRHFLKNGIDAETLLATGDGLARQVIERKVERELLDVEPDVLDSLVITARDVQATGCCLEGTKLWGTTNGFDFRAFVKEGISATEVLATGDPQARLIVRHTLERRRDG